MEACILVITCVAVYIRHLAWALLDITLYCSECAQNGVVKPHGSVLHSHLLHRTLCHVSLYRAAATTAHITCLSCGAATYMQVLQDHAEEFLQKMNAKEIAPKLKELEVIPESVKFDILQSKTKELANVCLLQHLKENAAEEAVMEVFRIASAERCYGRMNTFAASMLRELRQGLVLCVHTMHAVVMCLCKQKDA